MSASDPKADIADPFGSATFTPRQIPARGRVKEEQCQRSTMSFLSTAFVDGAGWRGVYDLLKKDGFNVSIVQKSDDLAAEM